MLFTLLPLALAATGALASSVCSSSLTVSSQSDLDGISSCSTFKGDITFEGSIATATLTGIEVLTGDLIVKNITTLSSISAPSLVNISGAFTLEILQSLSVVSFPKLTSAGDITFVTLNSLDTFQLDAGITEATSLIISDTTITSISGISLETVETLNINNNKYLTTLNFNLHSVSNILELSSTASDVTVTFPYLQWANNMTIQDISSVTLPNVTAINSTLSFTNNTLKSISCPKLKTIGGSLAIVSNDKLTNVSFPVLKSISGGFQIANNTNLSSIDGFPLLASVGGAIDFVGDFDNATLAKLTTVSGGVNIDSTSEEFNCSSWNEAEKDSVIRGDSYQCKAASVSTSISLVASTGSKTDSSDTATGTDASATATGSSSSKGGASAIEVSFLGAFAAVLFQFL